MATIAIEFSGFAILSFLAFRYVRRTTAIIAAGEGRLQRQARQYESIVNQLQQIVMQVDGDGRIVFVNDAWERILGHSVEATIGQPAASFLESGIEFSGEEPAPNSSASPREAPYHEMRFLTADGHPRWLEINIGHDDGANQGDHVLVTLSDVTEKHQSRIRESAANHELSLRQYALDQAVILAVTDPPPLNWSTLKYVFWQTGGPPCRRSATSPKRSSRSCGRSMCWSRRGNPLPMRSARSA